MKKRLIQGVVFGVLAGIGGVAVALWHKPDQMVGIVIATSLVGFVLGFLFEFKLI